MSTNNLLGTEASYRIGELTIVGRMVGRMVVGRIVGFFVGRIVGFLVGRYEENDVS